MKVVSKVPFCGRGVPIGSPTNAVHSGPAVGPWISAPLPTALELEVPFNRECLQTNCSVTFPGEMGTDGNSCHTEMIDRRNDSTQAWLRKPVIY